MNENGSDQDIPKAAYPAVHRVRRPRIARGALVVAATTAIVVSAAAVFAATPSSSPTATDGAATSTDPKATDASPDRPGHPGMVGGFVGSPFLGRFEITVASVSGVDVELETANGWSRTVDATGVTITRGDDEIALSELQPGDQVVLDEERNDDGTWTVTGLHVVLPHVGGIVTDVGDDTITVEQPDGTTATISVTDATTFTVPGSEAATLDDIDVDDIVLARGTLDADGTLVATDVWGGIGAGSRERLDGPWDGGPGHGGPGHGGQGWDVPLDPERTGCFTRSVRRERPTSRLLRQVSARLLSRAGRVAGGGASTVGESQGHCLVDGQRPSGRELLFEIGRRQRFPCASDGILHADDHHRHAASDLAAKAFCRRGQPCPAPRVARFKGKDGQRVERHRRPNVGTGVVGPAERLAIPFTGRCQVALQEVGGPQHEQVEDRVVVIADTFRALEPLLRRRPPRVQLTEPDPDRSQALQVRRCTPFRRRPRERSRPPLRSGWRHPPDRTGTSTNRDWRDPTRRPSCRPPLHPW